MPVDDGIRRAHVLVIGTGRLATATRSALEASAIVRVSVVRDEIDDSLIEGQGVGRRNDLRDQVGPGPRRVQHGAPFGAVHGHAGLAQHVLASLERRDRDWRMQIGPGADAHGIDRLIGDDVPPMIGGAGNALLLGRPRA